MVPRCLWIVSSHSRGARTKLAVGRKTTGMSVKSGPMTNPMSPMSWKSGSQLTPLSTLESLPSPWIMNASLLAARFPWVTATPLGREVEPLVNWRNARSSGWTSTARTRARSSALAGPAKASTVSMRSRRAASPEGDGASTGSTYGLVEAVVRRKRAPLALTMCRTVSW